MTGLRATSYRPTRRGRALATAYLATATFMCPACDRACEGPACASTWPATRLVVHETARWPERVAVWADARGVADGTVDQGASWSVRVREGAIWIGQPDARTVLAADAPATDTTLQQVARGPTIGVDVDSFGHDLDVDGRRVVVGAPAEDFARGGVWIFDAVPDGGDLTGADATVHLRGDALGDRLGSRVVACPDVDGDGMAEWLVAAPGVSAPQPLGGAVAWIRSTDLVGLSGEVAISAVATVWTSDVRGARLGSDVACRLDLSGDGVADLAVGAPLGPDGAGAVYLFDGADVPPSGTASEVAARVLDGPYGNGWFGDALATGDFDGDGVGELVVGVPGFDAGRGRAVVYRAADLLSEPRLVPVTVVTGERARSPGDHLGRTVAAADLDGDGMDELLVGAPDWTLGDAYDVGRLFVWRGASAWPPVLATADGADHVVVGDRAFQQVGLALATGDIDGDRTAEIVLTTRIRGAR